MQLKKTGCLDSNTMQIWMLKNKSEHRTLKSFTRKTGLYIINFQICVSQWWHTIPSTVYKEQIPLT